MSSNGTADVAGDGAQVPSPWADAPELQGLDLPGSAILPPAPPPAVPNVLLGNADTAVSTVAPPPDITTTPSVSAGYEAVGSLSLEMMLNTPASRFAELDQKVVQVRDWVQRSLTDQGVANRVADARMDPATRAEIAQLIDRLALQYITAERVVHGQDAPIVIALVIAEIVGLGPLDPLIADPRVTEIMVNGPRTCFIEVAGRVHRVPGVRFRDREHLLEMCQRILRPLNRSVDQRNPLEDGRLPDGARVNVVHPTVAADGPILTIRRFGDDAWTLPRLVDVGGLNEDLACFLTWLIRGKVSILISGGTGSGKTTALNAIAGMIPRGERLLTVEDSRELRLPDDAHVVALEARPAAANGEGAVSIRHLVRNALRMRPSRIIVGEVRDAAAVDMLTAMNTGHEGSLTTLHANGPEEVPDRLSVMIAQSGEIPATQVARFLSSAIDVIVHIRRYEDGSRRIASVHQVLRSRESSSDEVSLAPLWEWEYGGVDEDGVVVGEYRQLGELSEGLVRERRLANTPIPTWKDVCEWAGHTQAETGTHAA